MSRVAMISVAISVMVMVVAVCVVAGFSYEIDSKVKGILSSYQIVKYSNNFSLDSGVIERDEAFEQELSRNGFRATAYATKAALAKANGELSGVELKGLDDSLRLGFYGDYLVSGRLPSIGLQKPMREIMISKSLSEHLKVESGDYLELMFLEEPPLRERYLVTGVYDTSLGMLDKILVITDLRNVQYVYEWDAEHIGGYDVVGGLGYDALCDIVDSRRGESLMVKDIRTEYPQIYSWLELQKSNEFIIIAIMLVVGIINIVSVVLILLLKNIYQIGVFTILGMRLRDIQRIFVLNSSILVLKAVAVGNIVAIMLLYVQQRFEVVKLDAVGYSVDSVPVYFAWGKLLLINVMVIVVMLFFQWITTFVVSKVTPSKILKYEKR